jgi:hypothetical protein
LISKHFTAKKDVVFLKHIIVLVYKPPVNGSSAMGLFADICPTFSVALHFTFFNKFWLAIAALYDKRYIPQCVEHHGNCMENSVKDFIGIIVTRNTVVRDFTSHKIKISEAKVIKRKAIEVTYKRVVHGFNNVSFPFAGKKEAKRILRSIELRNVLYTSAKLFIWSQVLSAGKDTFQMGICLGPFLTSVFSKRRKTVRRNVCNGKDDPNFLT